jgi:HD-like signal output (HDOD) protein
MNLPLPTLAASVLTFTGMGFPSSLNKIDRLIQNGTANPVMLTALINGDPLLTAQILGQANSTNPLEITRLAPAITYLGMGSVHGLIRSTKPIPSHLRASAATCWTLASNCAHMTNIVLRKCQAKAVKQLDPAAVFNAGLLHDLGHLMTLLNFNNEYQLAAQTSTPTSAPFDRLLRNHIGADPATLGTLLATYWRLPHNIINTIRFHQTPLQAEGFQDLVSIVHVSRCLVRALGFTAGADRYLERLDEAIFEHLDLPFSAIESILTEFYEQMNDLEMYEVGMTV